MLMIHWNFKNWIYISLENPFKTMKQLKGVFRPLRKYFRMSFKEWDYSPVLWCSRPSFIQIMTHDVMWKDKYDSPRYEVPPYIWIHVYKLNLVWYWDLPINLLKDSESHIDDYWEQALWYLYYTNTISQVLLGKSNIEMAKESWPWQDYETEKSTWNDKFLMK